MTILRTIAITLTLAFTLALPASAQEGYTNLAAGVGFGVSGSGFSSDLGPGGTFSPRVAKSGGLTGGVKVAQAEAE